MVCGVLKLYFRELPQPVIPTELFHSLAKMLGKTTQTPPPPEAAYLTFRKYRLSAGGNFSVRLLLLLWTAVNLSACSVRNLQL